MVWLTTTLRIYCSIVGIVALKILQLAEIFLLGHTSRHSVGFFPLLLLSTKAGAEE